MKTLKDIKVNETTTVVKLHGDGPVRRRIMDMGITKGVEIYVRKKEFEIAVFDNKSLVLSNIFKYGNNSDISYLILLVLKHLNINKDAMELYISGMVDRDMFTSVERFFPKVILYVGKKVDFSDNEMYRIPLYQYSMLLR